MTVRAVHPLRYLIVLALCLSAGAGATAVQGLVWKVLLAVHSRTDEQVTGALVTRDGGVLAQLNVSSGKAGTAAFETRFVRVRSDGSVEWLSHTPLVDEGGLLAEAADGGWYSVHVQPVGDLTNADLVVRRRSAQGQLLWSVLWDAPVGARTTPHAVAVDSAGNLLIAGEAGGLPTIWKYEATGTLIWSASHPNPGAYTHLLLDGADRAVAGGTLAQSQDGFLISVYEPAGALAWSHEYRDPSHPREILTALAVSPSGEICASGIWLAAKTGAAGINTLRYRGDGAFRWSQRYSDEDLGALWPTGVALDEQENAYVSITGFHRRGDTCLLIKYDLAAEPQWWETRKHTRGLRLPNGNLRIDHCGNLYAFRATTRGSRQFNVATYNTHGNVLRDFSYRMGAEPLLADLDRHGNALALSNPFRNKARKRDGCAIKVRHVHDPKKCR